jgi:hypothetical protein
MLITFDFYNVYVIMPLVSWTSERTDEFDEWWECLTDQEQRKVVASVEALQELGPSAGRPLVDTVEGSKHLNMKELRVTQRCGSSSPSIPSGRRFS